MDLAHRCIDQACDVDFFANQGAVDAWRKSRRRQSHNTGVLPMSQKEPGAPGLSIKRKIAASRLYGPAPAETNMISMNADRISGR
jgi:hypothetical protein